jgi:pSer/pThr/pTyr-binding forkhead associated (FHA) protein
MLIYSPPFVFLRDKSTNGTYLNGQKIKKTPDTIVHNSDEIILIKNNVEKISYQLFLTDQQQTTTEQLEQGPHQKYEITKTLGK